MRSLTASDRASLIRLASSLPPGSPERRTILATIVKAAKVKDGGGKLGRVLTIRGKEYTHYHWDIGSTHIFVELSNDKGDSLTAEVKERLSDSADHDAAVANVDESLRSGFLPGRFSRGDFS